MKDNEFWVAFWKLAAAVLMVASITAGGCTAHGDRVVATMVKDGANPMAASCAIHGVSQTNTIICNAAASR